MIIMQKINKFKEMQKYLTINKNQNKKKIIIKMLRKNKKNNKNNKNKKKLKNNNQRNINNIVIIIQNKKENNLKLILMKFQKSIVNKFMKMNKNINTIFFGKLNIIKKRQRQFQMIMSDHYFS